MRVTHEPIIADLVDLELVELKFIFDRCMSAQRSVLGVTAAHIHSLVHYDNRDFDILPNYQPRSQPSFGKQTTLFGKEPGVSIFYLSFLENE